MRNVRVKGQTVSVAFSTYVDVPDSVVHVDGEHVALVSVLGAKSHVLSPVHIGRVEKGTRSWERRSKGNRYVNARGRTPEWHGWVPNSRNARPDVTGDTRGEVLAKLIARHLHAQGKSRVVSR